MDLDLGVNDEDLMMLVMLAAGGSISVLHLSHQGPNTSPKQQTYFDNAQTAQMAGGDATAPLSATWCADKTQNCAEEASIPPRHSRAGGREFSVAAGTHSRRHLQFLKT